MTDEKYGELFPGSSYETASGSLIFFDYAQSWLNSREVVDGTRRNYLSSMNLYWVPAMATIPIDQITPAVLRKIVGSIEWPSPGTKRAAIQRLSALFKTALIDGLVVRNPCEAIELPPRPQKAIDPFTKEEAEQVIAHFYATLTGTMRIYAAYFEFAFFTGMRPSEIAALRWDEADKTKRVAHVCRIVADYKVHERTKTKSNRLVMLNTRAMHALEEAKAIVAIRARQSRKHPKSPYIFPPTKNFEFIQ